MFAGELQCERLVIVTYDDERTIEKDGYRIDVVPVAKWNATLTQP